ncbi:alpha,alpha-trehalase ath1 [Tilletia horrida]|nr:alpha,alpha-trehalase ath1 [Tilletia horrida]
MGTGSGAGKAPAAPASPTESTSSATVPGLGVGVGVGVGRVKAQAKALESSAQPQTQQHQSSTATLRSVDGGSGSPTKGGVARPAPPERQDSTSSVVSPTDASPPPAPLLLWPRSSSWPRTFCGPRISSSSGRTSPPPGPRISPGRASPPGPRTSSSSRPRVSSSDPRTSSSSSGRASVSFDLRTSSGRAAPLPARASPPGRASPPSTRALPLPPTRASWPAHLLFLPAARLLLRPAHLLLLLRPCERLFRPAHLLRPRSSSPGPRISSRPRVSSFDPRTSSPSDPRIPARAPPLPPGRASTPGPRTSSSSRPRVSSSLLRLAHLLLLLRPRATSGRASVSFDPRTSSGPRSSSSRPAHQLLWPRVSLAARSLWPPVPSSGALALDGHPLHRASLGPAFPSSAASHRPAPVNIAADSRVDWTFWTAEFLAQLRSRPHHGTTNSPLATQRPPTGHVLDITVSGQNTTIARVSGSGKLRIEVGGTYATNLTSTSGSTSSVQTRRIDWTGMSNLAQCQSASANATTPPSGFTIAAIDGSNATSWVPATTEPAAPLIDLGQEREVVNVHLNVGENPARSVSILLGESTFDKGLF